MISIKIGGEEIFKESLYDMEKNFFIYKNENYQINNNQIFQNQQNFKQNYFNENQKLEKNIDIFPTFLEKQNKDKINRDLIMKLEHKKKKLEQIIQTKFDNNLFKNYSNNICEIIKNINDLKKNVNNNNKSDYSNFKNLIILISALDLEQTSQHLNEIKEEDYLKLLPNQKIDILNYINKYKNDILINLNCINKVNNNNNQNNQNNNYNNSQIKQKQQNNNIYNNPIINNNNSNSQNSTLQKYNEMYNLTNKNNQVIKHTKTQIITKEKYDLFKTMTGLNLSNEKISNYLNSSCPNVQSAVNKFYQSIYKVPYLTLKFYNPSCGDSNRRLKVHNFYFISSSKELFNQAIMDWSSIQKPRLFTENKEEIFLSSNIKCIGAFNLKNNQVITVKYV